MNEPIFLTLDDVLRIHARSLAEHGGSEGIRDLGLIESALASAKNILYFGSGDWLTWPPVMHFISRSRRHLLMETSGRQPFPRWFSGAERGLCPACHLGPVHGHDRCGGKEKEQG